MPTLRFEGYSDDTFGEYAHTNDDFDNCASGKPIDWLVTVPGQDLGLVVTGQYGRRDDVAGWQIAVGSYDPEHADTALPEWPMRFVRGERDYSPALIIEAPDGVKVTCLNRTAS